MKKLGSLHLSHAAAVAAFLAASFAPYSSPALAENKAGPALEAFAKTFAEVKDYRDTVSAHETSDDGKESQNRVYAYKWMRPVMARIEVLEGPGKGGGAVWTGGETVRGHQGGILSGIHLTVDIHDKRAVSLRGDTIVAASFDHMIKHFLSTGGALTEAAGPPIDGTATIVVTLNVAEAKSNGNITKEVLYLGAVKHLPVRHDAFVGTRLVKSETFKNMQTNTGMKAEDFTV